MKVLLGIILLPLFATLVLGQSTSHIAPRIPSGPEGFAQKLYQQVLARPSVGIPYGKNLRIYKPYLSTALLEKMDIAVACGRDFYRQHPENPKFPEKPPFAWLELGTFTGGDEEGEFHAFQIEKTELENDGSVQVNLKLTWGVPPEKPWFSNVALVVRRENGRYVMDDIIYREVGTEDLDWRLTQALASGCKGRHWVGNDGAK